MTTARRGRARLAAGGALLLGAASPPAVLPLAEFLVLPGLMVWFALATASERPLRDSYLYGCLFMAWFSASLRHVLVPAYAAVIVLGGLYFVLGTAAVRAAPARARGPVFAVAVGATFWLRAVMPDIHYPHGQPCHCLWQWPVLLGALPVGGEPLCNALLGAIATAAVGLWRSWQVGEPAFAGAWWRLGAVVVVAGVASLPGALAGPSGSGLPGPVVVAAVEPGLHPLDPYAGLDRAAAEVRYQALLEERLFAPTRATLHGSPAPDLVLWPESSLLETLAEGDLAAGRVRLLANRLPASPARLVVGTGLQRQGKPVPVAVMLRVPDGAVLGHHEKQRLVPGGEFLPAVRWLPAAASAWIHRTFSAALGSAPECVPGRALPPLTTAAGQPFGVLLCYDNAFPEPAAGFVAAGAHFLCVLSNEAWYRGGAELPQLVAMTVCRAIELQTPIVRCTTDGWSVHVDAGGRVVAELPRAAAPQSGPRILRCEVTVDPGRQVPMAWHRAAAGPFLAGLLVLALLHGALRRARLRGARAVS